MAGLSFTAVDLDLKVGVEDALAVLNIPHKTMLTESKVLKTVRLWAEAESEEHMQDLMERTKSPPPQPKKEEKNLLSSEQSSRANSPPSSATPVSTPLATPVATPAATPVPTAVTTPNVKDGKNTEQDR